MGYLELPREILAAAVKIRESPSASGLRTAISTAERGGANPRVVEGSVQRAKNSAQSLVEQFHDWWMGRIDNFARAEASTSCFEESELQSLIASAREAVKRATNPFENFPGQASAAEQAVADLSKRLSEKLKNFREALVARIEQLKTTTPDLTGKCDALIALVKSSDVCNPDFGSQLGDLDREVTSINAENEQKQQEVCL